MSKQPLTVSALTKYLKYTFDHDVNLQNILLKGEVSNFKHHSRGHFYFTLKDDQAQINAVMFQSQSKNVNFKVEDGMDVIVEGHLSLYVAGGSYQIYVSRIILDGIGELYLKFEKLKEQLAKEGLFDSQNKKPIPRFPNRIAVITSNTGAAIRDIVSTIERRYPVCELLIFPTLVQGEQAKHAIVESLQKANSIGGIDTIILGRGGGSIEDLWCFNEEIVARAIYESKIPIISAVGHETDFTISDFVSDMRAATPTAAAELAVPNRNEVLQYLSNLKQRASQTMYNRLNNQHVLLNKLQNSYVFQNPKRILEQHHYKIDHYVQRLERNSPKSKLELHLEKLNGLKERLTYQYKNKIVMENHRFIQLIDKLELVNPLSILTKGYSITKKEEMTIKQINDVNINDEIDVLLQDGTLRCLVKEKVSKNG